MGKALVNYILPKLVTAWALCARRQKRCYLWNWQSLLTREFKANLTDRHRIAFYWTDFSTLLGSSLQDALWVFLWRKVPSANHEIHTVGKSEFTSCLLASSWCVMYIQFEVHCKNIALCKHVDWSNKLRKWDGSMSFEQTESTSSMWCAIFMWSHDDEGRMIISCDINFIW